MKNLKPWKKLFAFFENLFFNGWVKLLSNKILSENFLNRIIYKNLQKILILSIFFFEIPGYNLSESLIFYKKNLRQTLGSPTLWEYRDKVSLRNIETFSHCYESSNKKL